MSDVLKYVPLPHWHRKVPRQVRVGATCLTVGCRHWRTDMLPSLKTCPGCQQPLRETRSVTG